MLKIISKLTAISIIIAGVSHLTIYIGTHNYNQINKYEIELKIIIKKLNENGIKHAYDYFREEYKKSKEKKIFHSIGHAIGIKIYEKLGIKGITTCDDTAGYGCFHGLFSSAYKNEPDFKEAAYKICESSKNLIKKIECIHGIGHGLMILSDPLNIDNALYQCANISKGEFLKDVCSSGIFMEYNISMHENNEIKIRPIKEPYDTYPCYTLSKEYKKYCYSNLAYWWYAAEQYEAPLLEKGCLSIKNKQDSENCIIGIGKIIPFAYSHDISEISRICSSLSIKENINICTQESSKRMSIDLLKSGTVICEKSADTSFIEKCKQNTQEFILQQQ